MQPFSLPRRAMLRLLSGLALEAPLRTISALESGAEGRIAELEKGIGVRLGVAAVDTGTDRRIGYRVDERFAMCSTFKLLLVADILKRVEGGQEDLKRPISFSATDLLEYAPGTRAHVHEGGMAVGELCAAAIELSDNTAANLLLAQVGGPVGFTAFARSLGDQVTRLDRTEPDLNSALPGDPRDTTSPAAMLESMQRVLTGSGLAARSQGQLAAWLEKSSTGTNRLRAGVPGSWRAGDKTGTGENGAMGDLGIFWPPARKPILIAAYVMEGNAPRAECERALADVGRLVAGD